MQILPIRTRGFRIPACAILSILALPACGGGGGGSGLDVTNSLNGLGIDTSASPRQSDSGGDLTADYEPVGKTLQIDPLMELYVGGISLHGSTSAATLVEDFSESPADSTGTISPPSLFELSSADAPWWSENLPQHSPRETRRAVAAADLDGDGIDEIVTVFADDSRLALQVLRRTDSGYATEEYTIRPNTPGITNVAIAAGDFDGDTKDDLAVGYVAGGHGNLLHLLQDDAGNFSIEPNTTRVFDPYLDGSSMEMILRTGNLDDDDRKELVALVNETAGDWSNPQMTSSYVVFDDKTAGYQELRSGFVEGFEAGVGLRVAAVADVSLGDIDGDNRDEIVFGGLAHLDRSCEGSPYVFVALDDATTGFASLGAKEIDVDLDGCANGTYYDLRFVHVRTLDLDGDGIAEVLGNQLVFEDWKNAAPWTVVPDYSLSSREFVDEDGLEWSDRTNCAVAVGDVTGDGRDDILVYREGRDEVRVFSLQAGETQIAKIGHLATADASGLMNPVLLPANVDKDTKVIRATGVHRFAWVEPIVSAVLAAPPCKFGIGQNTDACRTTFGNTSSDGTEFERSVSFSVAGIIGTKIETGILNTDVELEAKITHKLTLSAGVAYTLDRTVLFTTGPNEDTVVFTTVPIDVYQYQVIQHPDPTLIGAFTDLVLPRRPIFLQVERGYYNAHAPEGSLQIDQSILSHHIGDPQSYPTAAQKESLLAQYGGLQFGPQSVGQGAGETELDMEVGEEWNVGGELELEFELEAKTTITGFTLGMSVGSSVSSSIQFTSGHSTTYGGVVGSIDAAHFQQEQYSFGLFTYPLFDPNTQRQIEVINYWVE